MKRYIIALALLSTLTLSSCSREDDLRDTSSIVDVNTPQNDFDIWLQDNYMDPYNIAFEYRYNDILIDMEPALIPARYDEAILLAKLVKHLTLDVYDELTGSPEFMRGFFPKIIQLIGSPSYNADGSIVLGEAEGGKAMFLYNVNGLANIYSNKNIDKLNDSYFHTMHHEFAHILHQTKPYSKSYETISSSLYVGNNCFETYKTDESALKVGFITPYSATNSDEDFVEIISTYVTSTPQVWADKLSVAGKVGKPIIISKLDIIRDYLLVQWNIDIDELRDIVMSRQAEPTLWNFDYSLE